MFDDIVFPLEISRQSVAGPEFSTDVTETGGGFERRNQNWEGGRLRFNVAPGVRMRRATWAPRRPRPISCLVPATVPSSFFSSARPMCPGRSPNGER